MKILRPPPDIGEVFKRALAIFFAEKKPRKMRANFQGFSDRFKALSDKSVRTLHFHGGAWRLNRWIIASATLLALLFVGTTATVVMTLRNRLIAHERADLRNLALVLAEEVGRTFQSLELAQQALLIDVAALGISNARDFKVHMSSAEVRNTLKNTIAALPHIAELGIGDTESRSINSTGAMSLNSTLNAGAASRFKSDPYLKVAVGQPVMASSSGVVSLGITRKISDTRGTFLGTLNGVMHLDHFGTGYSSLSYLHSFSFDKIKIDRAFVMDIEYIKHSLAIVRAVIRLGRSLSIPILAEGVETEEQLALLAREGCDAVQGYLARRPSPASALFHMQVAQTTA